MSQPQVLSVGNMLVEIMRTGLNQPHWQAGTYAGPFLSGDAVIYADGEPDDECGCRRWANQDKLVVLKQGPAGCRIYHGAQVYDVPGFRVDEVDPTGADDAFCAGFTVALLEGMSLPDAGRFANAVGALAVMKLGPMEGVPARAEVAALLAGDGGG